MKRIVVLILFLLFLWGCVSPVQDKGTQLTQNHQDIVYLSEYEVDPYWFHVEDVEGGYVILWAPLNTNTEQLRVFNVGKEPVACDLYIAPDTEEPIQSRTIEPEESGLFENLTSDQCYYVGLKPEGSEVDIIIQD